MKKNSHHLILLGILCVLFIGCKSANKSTYLDKHPIPTVETNKKAVKWDPKTPYNVEEFRAAWVATVANINWPSSPGLPVHEQQKEALQLLDFLEENNFNAVIFQVRPQADALYKSNLEPWSYYLTGKQGSPPEVTYDPLQFWVQAAHERGLELHAWLNPYRAHHTAGGEISSSSIIKTNPELVVELENGMYWMDPSLKGTQEHSLAVVMDIVNRYDVDGIHFDDYFYPYDSYNNGKDFPDDKSWISYLNSGGKLSRPDWRRQSVNTFIKNVYTGIKEAKPHVKFGLSPFGIWRPGYPESVVGLDQYDKLYADAKLWLNKGWVDYYTPQLYWKINKIGQSFPELLGWWQSENTKQAHLWPGLNVGLGGDEKNADEVINQIMITRGMVPKSKGAVHWSIAPLIKYDSLALAIKQGPYNKKTLVPPSPWLNNTPPTPPSLQIKKDQDSITFSWNHPEQYQVFRWVLYYQRQGKRWEHTILNQGTTSLTLPITQENGKFPIVKAGLTAVDRTGNQSEFFELNIN
ncbi:glycoside hydrolase family 10 protein [Arenibacter latericius]|uniref:glycoside hydrolase family 10 protein n=1 Tax=Arenibacter latericius TaxID=86104 RepID=UPI0003F74CA2|nr:family 10 glycosylhydrolase [Arenibacter latericius]